MMRRMKIKTVGRRIKKKEKWATRMRVKKKARFTQWKGYEREKEWLAIHTGGLEKKAGNVQPLVMRTMRVRTGIIHTLVDKRKIKRTLYTHW